MNVCVYGASSDRIDPTYKQAAFDLGAEIARRGWTLVFGGGTTGLMGATVRGVQSEHGKSIGVTPTFFEELGVIHKSCTEIIYTDTMRIRKETMENKSDAFVTLPGGIGTYEEFFEVLTLKQLKQHSKPIILYNVNDYFSALLSLLQSTIDHGFMSKETMHLIIVCNTQEEVFKAIDTYEAPEVTMDYRLDIPYQR